MVTFHQNFAYEDFIEGIRPILKNGRLAYKLRAGMFRRIAKAAKKNPDKRFILIIDEINRGNIAKIFGELITLIEDSRRVGQPAETWITLPYSGKTFGVPDNLYIVGTMNTADRSIQLLDTALRRRFTFIEAMPNPRHRLISRNIDGVDCQEMLAAMNERIAALLDREHQIGHTYLLGVEEIGKLSDTFRNRMLPLLQEYFFDDWAKMRVVLGNNAFVTGKEVDIRSADRESMDEARFVYERLPDDDRRWEDPGEYRRSTVARSAGNRKTLDARRLHGPGAREACSRPKADQGGCGRSRGGCETGAQAPGRRPGREQTCRHRHHEARRGGGDPPED